MACPWTCCCDSPSPIFKVASNTRPCSKLGGTIEGTGGKGKMLYMRDDWLATILSKKGRFFRQCLNIFAAGCSISLGYPWFNNHGILSIKGKVDLSRRRTKTNQHTNQEGIVVRGTFSVFGTISIDEVGYTIHGILVLIRGEPDQPLSFEGRVCSVSQFWLPNRISHRTFWLISWTIY